MTNYESGSGPTPDERFGVGASPGAGSTGVPAGSPPSAPPPGEPLAGPPAAGPPPTEYPSDGSASDVRKHAADASGEVAVSAKEKARDVAGEAGQQAREVAAEARARARGLVDEARSQMRSQAATQRDRVCSGLRSLGDELDAMATKGDQSGPATEVARQASDRARALASYLDQHEPGDLLDEVREFARRRPGVFLFGAALAGVVAGRLTRGVAASSGGSRSSDDGQPTEDLVPPLANSSPLAGSTAMPPQPLERTDWPAEPPGTATARPGEQPW